MPTLQEQIEAFFVVFPTGAGEQWLASFFAVTAAQIAEACTAIGLERVERWSRPQGKEPAFSYGIHWQCWTK